MVAIVVALLVSYGLTRRLPVMALVSAVIVVVFGGATLVFQNETFIKLKPTIIYLLFTATLFGGLIFRKPLLAMVFDQVFHLTDEGWRKLTLRWALFFLALAILNEIVWRTQSTDTWVTFKVFGVMPLTFHLRGPAISAADEIRRDAEGRAALDRDDFSSNRHPSGALLRLRQRLFDLRLERRLQIVGGDRADQLVGDAAVAADHEGLRHAVDAPVDRGAAVARRRRPRRTDCRSGR